MNQLKINNINKFGSRGKQWLSNLPEIAKVLAEKWHLTNIKPVDNMSWNFVAKAASEVYGKVLLKISCNEQLIHDEIKTLEHFDGCGAVKLIAHDAAYHAMLLHQAVPGNSLRDIYPGQLDEVIENYSTVVSKLISVPQKDLGDFKHITHWFKGFERIDKEQLPDGLLEKAIKLKNDLLATRGKEFVLHGDLHHENILLDGSGWIAIDPKGIVGEVEFEAACFDFISDVEIKNGFDIAKLFDGRALMLANELNIDHQRLKDWVFVRLVLGACWMIEDRGKPDLFLNKIRAIFGGF